MLGRRGVLRFLALPPYVWLALFLVIPVGLIAMISLRPEPGPLSFDDPWTPSLVQYQRIFETPAYLRQLGISALMALIVALTAVVLAYPVAYFLTFRAGRRAPLYLTLLLVPFAVSFLLRVMAWRLMLGQHGAINSFLEWLGLTEEPLDLLIYSRAAVVVTLTYAWIPFAALPIYAAMSRIDIRQLEAAADLGAGPWTRFAARHAATQPARRGGFVLPRLHPQRRRVRHAAPGRRQRDLHVRPAHPGLLRSRRQLGIGVGRGGDHAGADHGAGGDRGAPDRPAEAGMRVNRAIGVGRTPVPLGTAYVLMLVLLYFPIGLLFLFSFNGNTILTFPLEELTLDWYGEAFADVALLEAARNSLVVAVGSATVATALGLAVSIAFIRFRFRGRTPLLALAVLPLVVPFIVLGVSLFLLFSFVDLPRSLLTIGAGHVVIALPFATLILLARMSGMDPALEDAAMDLGASYLTTLRTVVLPLIGTALLSAWLTCFIVSFDEVAIALFLAGGDPTFPVFLYGQLRFAQRLPVLIAMAVILMAGTVTLTLIAFRLGRRQA